MQKLFLISTLVLLLSGCRSKTLTCVTSDELKDYYKSEEKINFTFGYKYVKSVEMSQTMFFDDDYVKNNNFDLKSVKETYIKSFEETYKNEKNLNYNVDIIDNTVLITVSCKKDCLNNYMNYNKKTKDDILKKYNQSSGYICE